MASPAYYYKEKHIAGDRITYTYNCVLDGTVVETVKTRKQAQAWWERTMRDLSGGRLMNCVCKRRHDGEIETMCAWHWRNAVRMLNAGEIEKVRRERDDLIELLSGIGRQASEMAKSYKKE